jgi:hypothetical protein
MCNSYGVRERVGEREGEGGRERERERESIRLIICSTSAVHI